jgi:hypothetical protein
MRVDVGAELAPANGPATSVFRCLALDVGSASRLRIGMGRKVVFLNRGARFKRPALASRASTVPERDPIG